MLGKMVTVVSSKSGDSGFKTSCLRCRWCMSFSVIMAGDEEGEERKSAT